MKFIVFYLQLINYLEGLGMFFSSAALIRRLRKYNATSELGIFLSHKQVGTWESNEYQLVVILYKNRLLVLFIMKVSRNSNLMKRVISHILCGLCSLLRFRNKYNQQRSCWTTVWITFEFPHDISKNQKKTWTSKNDTWKLGTHFWLLIIC